MPTNILVVTIALGIGLWLIHMSMKQREVKESAESKVDALTRKVEDLDAQMKSLRDVLDDIVVGHVDEARIRRVLAHALNPADQ